MSEALEIPEPSPAERPRLTLKPLTPSPVQWAQLGLEHWRAALAYILAVATPVIAYVGNLAFAPLAALIGIGRWCFWVAGARRPSA